MQETEWIKQCKQGDTEAFSKLILPYEKKMLNFAFRILRDPQEAEDAVQDALLKAYRKIDSFTGDGAFSTWLFTILNHICLDIIRKKKRHGEHKHVSLHQESRDEDSFEVQIEDTAPGPDEVFRRKKAMEAVSEAIGELSEEHRIMIVLRDVQGMDYDEIVRITGLSPGTVKSRINRARLALRKILEKNRELFT